MTDSIKQALAALDILQIRAGGEDEIAAIRSALTSAAQEAAAWREIEGWRRAWKQATDPEAQILRILKDLPENERLEVLATVCAAFVQTNGTISNEATRNSRETVLGPLKRRKRI